MSNAQSPWRSSPTRHFSQRSLHTAQTVWSLHRSPSAPPAGSVSFSPPGMSTSWFVARPADLAHGLFDEERRWVKRPQAIVGAPWSQLVTDKNWNNLPANQIDVRCEAMRHVQNKLPPGNTAIERQQAAKRQASTPGRQGGLSIYAPVEASRFDLANTLPPAHDVLFRKSAMPVASSLLADYRQSARRPRRP